MIAAEERRKSRRFDEDRRAYGHIRRFIERHAGGRPAEWEEPVPQGGDGDGEALGLEGLVGGIDGARGERRYRRQQHHHRHSDAAGAGIGYREGARGGARDYPGSLRKQEVEDAERPFLGVSSAARRGGGGLGAASMAGRATGACDDGRCGPRQQQRQRSPSIPRQAVAAASFAPDDTACAAESSECLYSEVYRNGPHARFGASRGVGGSGGAVDGGRGGGGGDRPPSQDDTINHGALKFSAGSRENPRARQHAGPRADDPQRARSSRIADGRRKVAVASDDEWAGGAESAPYCSGGDAFSTAAAAAAAAWRETGTDNTTISPRRGWRGLGDETEETEPESEARSGRSAAARGFGRDLEQRRVLGARWGRLGEVAAGWQA